MEMVGGSAQCRLHRRAAGDGSRCPGAVPSPGWSGAAGRLLAYGADADRLCRLHHTPIVASGPPAAACTEYRGLVAGSGWFHRACHRRLSVRTPGIRSRNRALTAWSAPTLKIEVERVMGIEPTTEAWEASVLPLN